MVESLTRRSADGRDHRRRRREHETDNHIYTGGEIGSEEVGAAPSLGVGRKIVQAQCRAVAAAGAVLRAAPRLFPTVICRSICRTVPSIGSNLPATCGDHVRATDQTPVGAGPYDGLAEKTGEKGRTA
jgi:hypothetical protein